MPAPKPVVSVESVNAICYNLSVNAICQNLGHDISFGEKSWIIPAFKSHVHYLAQRERVGYEYARVEHLIDQWLAIRQGKLNPVPRSYP